MHYLPRLACLLILALPSAAWADDAGIALFEKQVRPLLVQHCYECHSSQTKELKGGLALDSKAGWVEGGDSGPAITPGEVDDSLLINAVRYEDIEMPPKGKLSAEEIAILEKWVKLGAPDPRDGPPKPRPTIKKFDLAEARQFWSFQPVQSHTAPQVTNREWPRDDLDRFILAKLEEKGLAPAAGADRRSWIRRVTFDLTGLPPTPKEVEAFLASPSDKGIEQVVDRLLESPHFGEHWGRHWLDVARYADSNGSDFNATYHNAWRYRNYVVAAMNQDKPFDRFIREQLAGDLMRADSDQQRTDQIVATGFLMIGAKMLSERDKKKLEMDIVDEQIDTVGRAFLGMTLGCARCHDHKFDPIPTEDYYALAGIFRSTTTIEGESQQYVSTWKPSNLPVSADTAAAAKEFDTRKKPLQASVDLAKKELKSQESLARLKSALSGIIVDDIDAQRTGVWKSSTLSPNFVGNGYIHDDNQGKGEKLVIFTPDLPKTAQYEVQLSYTPGKSRANNVPVTIKHAEGEAQVSFDQRPAPPIEKRFKSIGRFLFEAGKSSTVAISNKNTNGHVIVDAVRFIELDEQGDPVAQSAQAIADDLKKAHERIKQAKEQLVSRENELKALLATAPPPLPKALAVYESKKIGDCEIRIRGVHKNLGPIVPRGFLQVVTTPEDAPAMSVTESGRRELADWIASADHPLTARVIVNRIWYHLIGEGIVRSVDNFGQLGDRPTHPELLDRLAFDFTHDGWSIKRLVRRIVLSRVYAMSSDHNEQAWQADPENKLLWRAHRRRLPAEAIRDSLLSISGQLDTTLGESPVRGLGTLVTNNSANEGAFKRSETQQRSMYLPIIRSQLPSILTVFDFADPDMSTGKRNVTNVPAQALLLMNSPFVMDCCQRIATDLLADQALSDRDRVRIIYEKILSRVPNNQEAQRMISYVAARNTSGVKADARSKPWAELVQVLFASTEFCLLH